MNTGLTAKERERLEATIEEEVDSQVGFYRQLRAVEQDELVARLEGNPSKEAKSALEAFGKAKKALQGLGYEFKVDYRVDGNCEPIMEYGKHKDVQAFKRETDENIGKLNSIKRRTLMKLYTATSDNEILNELLAEIQKVVGGTVRKTCPEPREP